MSSSAASRLTIQIAEQFFCDGHYYVLTSASLGGSDLTPAVVSQLLTQGKIADLQHLLVEGICLPLCFDGDCALDQQTVFVVGALTAQEEQGWIARLVSKLHIPCGQLVLLCGGGDPDEFAYAVSGQPPQEHYEIFQVIDVPPGSYLVEVYAYLNSMTVQQSLGYYDRAWNYIEDTERQQWYETHRPGPPDLAYLIRLAPLEVDPPLPALDPDMGWCSEFEFRSLTMP